MKKRINKWNITVAGVLAISTLATAISCGATESPKEPIVNNDPIIKTSPKTLISDNLITGAVKYVALGDSITAGFNSEIGSDAPGKLDDNTITGLSYPSFLAEYIKENNPEKLNSYENFGLSGSRVVDWLYFLQDPSQNDSATHQEFFSFWKNLDQMRNNHFKNRLSEQFDNFQSNKYEYLTNKIKDANLLTLTLGANDLFFSDLMIELLNSFSSDSDVNSGLEFLNKIQTELSKVKNNLKLLVARLKEINPNLNINLIGYPMLLINLSDLIKTKLPDMIKNLDVTKLLLGFVNNTIKSAASESGVNYIATDDEDDWTKEKQEFVKVFFEIHPSAKGYKKMAQDIFLKLSLKDNYSFVSEHSHEVSKTLMENWDKIYFDKDANLYKQQIQFENVSNEQLIKKVVGPKENLKLWLNNSLENQSWITEAIQNRSFVDIIKSFLKNNPNKLNSYVDPLFSFIKSLGIDFKSEELKTLLKKLDSKGQSNFSKFIMSILETDFLDDIINKTLDDFEKLDLDKNSIAGVQSISESILIETILKHINNPDNIYKFIKQLFNTSYFGQDPEAPQVIKTIIKSLLKSNDIIKKLLISSLSSDKSSPLYGELVSASDKISAFFASNTKVQDLTDYLVNTLFENKNIYLQEDNLFDFLSLILKSNKTEFLSKISSILHTLTSDINLSESVSILLKHAILKKLEIKIPDYNTNKMLSQFLYKIILNLNSSSLMTKFQNTIYDKLSDSKVLKEIIMNKELNTSIFKEMLDFNNIDNVLEATDLILQDTISEEELWDFINMFLKKTNKEELLNALNLDALFATTEDKNEESSTSADSNENSNDSSKPSGPQQLNATTKEIIEDTETSTNKSSLDFINIVKKLFIEKQWTNTQKTKLKSLSGKFINYFLEDEKSISILKYKLITLSKNAISNIEGFESNDLNEVIESVFTTLVESKDIKNLILDIIETLIDYPNKFASAKTFSELLNSFFTKEKITEFVNGTNPQSKYKLDNILQSILTNNAVGKTLAKQLFKKMKLEIPEEKNEKSTLRVAEFFAKVGENISDIPFMASIKTKLINLWAEKGIDLFLKKEGFTSLMNLMSEIDMTNTETMTEMSQLISPEKIPADLFGDLINIIMEYSPLPADLNSMTAESHPFYFYLNNINKNPIKSKRTYLSASAALSGSASSSNEKQGKMLGELVGKLYKAYEAYEAAQTPSRTGIQRNNPYYKSIYRLTTIALFYAYESQFREANSFIKAGFWTRSPFYPTSADREFAKFLTKNNSAPQGLQNIITDIFGNTGVESAGWFGSSWTYPNAKNYKKQDLIYIIYYSNGGTKKSRFDANRTHVQDLLKYIKQGHSDRS